MKHLPLFLSAAVLLGVATAKAQDKATLDLLVKKGVISQTEADELVKNAPAKNTPATAKESSTSKVTVGGFVQARYTGIVQNEKGAGVADPASTNGFTARRVVLNFAADIKDGWNVFISPEFDGAASRTATSASGTTVTSTSNPDTLNIYLDNAGIKHTCDAGVAVAGLKKVNFGREEYTSACTDLLPVERSVATQYLATNAFASRHTGLFWDGKVKDTGFAYGAAVTNGAINSTAPTSINNELAVWANVAYTFTCPLTGAKATAGLNTGYIGENSALFGNAYPNFFKSAFGYNPFITLVKDKASFTAELIGWDVNGTNGAPDVKPVGYNLTAAYKVTDSLEPVVRFSQLKADNPGVAGLGVSNSGAVYGAQAAAPVRGYDNVWSLYTGVNYYIVGNTLKVQGGYEFSQLTGSAAAGSQIDAHAVRVQIQAMF